jgi:carboxypeptidase family protein
MGAMPRNRWIGITATMVILTLVCGLIVLLASDDGEVRGRDRARSRADAGLLPDGRSPEQMLAFFRRRLAALADDEAPGGSNSIVGKVIRDEDERPVADVSVFLVPLEIEHWSLLRDLFPGARGLEVWPPSREPTARAVTAPSRPRMTESGEDGSFAFGALAAGRYALVAHPVGRPPVAIPEIEVGVGDEERVVVRSRAGKTLRGRITDLASGEPVPAARVSVSRSIWLSAVTDADGEYEMLGGRDGLPVLVFAEGYPTHEFVSIDLSEGAFTGNLALDHGTAIRGRVLDPGGHGVPEARVAASLDGALGFPDHERPWTRVVKTDADGAFHVQGLPRGLAFVIWAHADGCAPVVSPSIGIDFEVDTFQAPEASLVLAGHDVSNVLLTLRPAGSACLRVLDEERHPLESAEIEGYRRIEDAFAPFFGPPLRKTGHQGLYELNTLPAGRYDLTVLSRGLARETIRLEVSAGETLTRDVVLRRGATVTGQVLDPASRPLADWPVEAWPADELPVGHEFMSPRSQTAADGRFELTGLEAGRAYVICAVPGWSGDSDGQPRLGVSAPIRVRAGQQGVVLRTRRSSVLRARLVEGETGKPVEMMEVGLRAIGDQAAIAPWVMSTPESGFVDRDGWVTLAGVAPGDYAIEIDSSFHVIVSPRTVEIPDDGSPVELEVRLGPGNDRDFAGSVVWDDGGPVSGIGIRVVGEDPLVHLRSLTTDRMGKFETHGLPGGRHRLILSGSTLATIWLLQWDEVTIGADDEPITIKLGSRDRGAICVRTLGANGRAIPGARVTVRDASGKVLTIGAGLSEARVRRCRAVLEGGDEFSPLLFRYSARLSAGASLTNQFGLLLRGSLSPGPVEIEIEATGYETVRIRATIRSGQKIYREIVLDRGE